VHHVYIMASHGRTLYTGMTNDIQLRARNHKRKTADGFSRKYNCVDLVYFEVWATAPDAIRREKQIKGWSGPRKSPSSNPPARNGKT